MTIESESVEIKTGSGETAVIKPSAIQSKYAWNTREITKDCPDCPFFVSPTELLIIIEAVRKARLRVDIPQSPQGLCLFGETIYGSTLVPKFLDTPRKPHHCGNPSSGERSQRAKERRKIGKLK